MSEETHDQATAAAPDATPADQSTAQTGTAEGTPNQEEIEAQERAEQEQTEKKPWYKKRFDELTRKRYEAEAKIEAEKERAAKLEKELEEARKPKQAEPPPVNFAKPKPVVGDFQTYEDYVDAVTDWKLEKKESEAFAKRLQEEETKKQAEKANEVKKEQQTFDEKRKATIETGKGKYKDFDEVVQAIPGQILTFQMAQVIVDSDNGSDVIYHLGKNIQEAERISKLNPWAMAREIGKIEERLKLTEKKTTKAPPPINPNPGKADVIPEIDPEKDPAGWIAARNAGKI